MDTSEEWEIHGILTNGQHRRCVARGEDVKSEHRGASFAVAGS